MGSTVRGAEMKVCRGAGPVCGISSFPPLSMLCALRVHSGCFVLSLGRLPSTSPCGPQLTGRQLQMRLQTARDARRSSQPGRDLCRLLSSWVSFRESGKSRQRAP